MSASDEVYRQLDEAERTMRQAEARLGDFGTLRPLLAELVGTADAAEDKVHVEWTAQGLSRLDIEPRAMRLPSDELAAEIRTAVAEAMADLRAKTRTVLTGAGLAAGAPYSADDVRAQLARIRETTIDGARRAVGDIDRASPARRGGTF